MDDKTGSGRRACASIYFRFGLLLGLCPRYRSHFSSDFHQIWNVDPLCQEKEQVPSVTQREEVYAHARNLTSGFFDQFAQSALERWFTSEMFESYMKSRSLNPFLMTNL